MVSGGVKENVLPPFASAMVNFRILQGETVRSVVEQVRKIIDDDRVELTVDPATSIDPSPVSDPHGAEYRVIEKSIRQAWDLPGMVVSPYLVIGGADAKYFASSIAKNVYRFTALHVESAADTARWHGTNERVLVEELPRCIVFFHQLIANAEEL
jgi:carboxypeptidase PM20D1